MYFFSLCDSFIYQIKKKKEKIPLLYGPPLLSYDWAGYPSVPPSPPDEKGSVSIGSKQRPVGAKRAHRVIYVGLA